MTGRKEDRNGLQEVKDKKEVNKNDLQAWKPGRYELCRKKVGRAEKSYAEKTGREGKGYAEKR